MAERIPIFFEMDKEDILNMFFEDKETPYIPQALEKFLENYFSSYIEIHVQNIRNNMKALNQEMEEEKMEQIAIKYLKTHLEKEDMEALQIEAVKAFFRESFTNRKAPNIAIYDAFEASEVIAIAENIQKKLRYQLLYDNKITA